MRTRISEEEGTRCVRLASQWTQSPRPRAARKSHRKSKKQTSGERACTRTGLKDGWSSRSKEGMKDKNAQAKKKEMTKTPPTCSGHAAATTAKPEPR